MVALRIGQAAELLGVSVDTVRRLADRGEIAATRSAAGTRSIDGEDLARYLREQVDRTEAGRAPSRSARNRFTGLVTDVRVDGLIAQVEIHTGRFRVVSILTSEAVEELGLAPGMVAAASVKATSVVVEVEPPD